MKLTDEPNSVAGMIGAADGFHLHFIDIRNYAQPPGVRLRTLERTPVSPDAGFRGAVVLAADSAKARLPGREADGLRVTLGDAAFVFTIQTEVIILFH